MLGREKPITIGKALRDARAALPGDEAALEAEVLLMHALGIDRAKLYACLDEPLSSEESAAFARLVARRKAHEPLAYITGHREFFGLEFEVTRDVLIPRPETETLVEVAIAFVGERAVAVADIGVGSGIIAVSLAKALPKATFVGTDVSKAALEVARRNAERHGVADRIDFREGELLAPIEGRLDVIVSNPPYVKTAELGTAQPEIREHEPRVALDGGSDGLDVIRRLLAEAPVRLAEGGPLFCEIGASQGEAVRALATAAFPAARIEIMKDLGGRDRVLCVYV
jgi:release factor glutamine methyltransferase